MILYHLTLANLKMIIRDRQAVFWALAFPLIFVIVFGLFFRDVGSSVTLAVIDRAQDDLSARLMDSLSQADGIDIERHADETAARQAIADGDLANLLIIPQNLAAAASDNPPAQLTLVFDETDPFSGVIIGVVGSFVDKTNLAMAQATERIALAPERVSSRAITYLDFLIPALAVWGVMNFSIIGLATTIAAQREKRILVRILATPLKVRIFFMSKVLSALVVSLAQAAIILAAGWLLFGVAVNGNPLQIAALIILGNIVFLNLGFVVGAFSRTVAAASGLGNAVALPLMFLSGVFFPTENLPAILRVIVEYLPLAPMLEMVRGIAIESKALWQYPLELAIVSAWILLSAIAAIRTFRFR